MGKHHKTRTTAQAGTHKRANKAQDTMAEELNRQELQRVTSNTGSGSSNSSGSTMAPSGSDAMPAPGAAPPH
jgi:hypothetical protein